MKKLFYITLIWVSTIRLNAQTPGEEYNHNDIFRGFLGWDIRVGGEKNTLHQIYFGFLL